MDNLSVRAVKMTFTFTPRLSVYGCAYGRYTCSAGGGFQRRRVLEFDEQSSRIAHGRVVTVKRTVAHSG